jgi:hypothetical protein
LIIIPFEIVLHKETTYKKKSTGFQKFQKFRPDKPESHRNRWGSVKYSTRIGKIWQMYESAHVISTPSLPASISGFKISDIE